MFDYKPGYIAGTIRILLMEITWGGLEDISRPASSERTRSGSRVSTSTLAEGGRISRSSPTSLEVLSSDIEDKDKVASH